MKRLYKWITTEVVQKGQSRDEPLFQIKHSRWAQLLKNASIKSLGKPISTHTIRRSFATFLKDMKGFDLIDISNYLGHSSISTTQIYLSSSETRLKEKFDKLFNQKGENQNEKS